LIYFSGELRGFSFDFCEDRLVILGCREIYQVKRVLRASLHGLPWLELLAQRGQVTHDLLRGGLVRPQVW
jgi:hypothetical protein